MAVAAAVGALRPSAVPLLFAMAAMTAAASLRRPALLCAGVALLTSVLAERALAGLDEAPEGPVAATVQLLTDPEPAGDGVRADARVHGRRVELRAGGLAAEALRPRLAGERVLVRGLLAPAPSGAPWLVSRHIAARLTVHRIEPGPPPDPASRIANTLRRTLVDGATSLSPSQRSLFTGLVIGDDRAQSAALADDFQGAGLTHLLAVSGQNVAFVLALAGPLARRLRLWPRLVGTIALVGLFGLLTRFEPSVLRAAAMAALAALTMTVARPTSRLRLLALAVTGLLVVDPLLVGAVGFQLSVAAAAAIVLLAVPIAGVLPGPRWIAGPLGVTMAAQLGVAPVLLAAFGPLPVAALPANLLAVPAAGAVMAWGLTGGLLAGLLGGTAAEVLHLPTRLLLGWIEQVAARAAAAPLGELGPREVAGVAVGVGLAVLAHRCGSVRWRGVGLALGAASIAVAVLVVRVPPPLRSALAPGIVRWHDQEVDIVALGGAGWRTTLGAAATLEHLRRAGVGSITVLVLVDPSVPGRVVDAVAEHHPLGAVIAPRDLADPPGEPVTAAPRGGAELVVGDLLVTVVQGEQRLVVEARPAPRDSG